MIRIQKYTTKLKRADIDNWLIARKNEKTRFRFKGYTVKSDEYGFSIRERNLKTNDSNPRTIAKYIDSIKNTIILHENYSRNK